MAASQQAFGAFKCGRCQKVSTRTGSATIRFGDCKMRRVCATCLPILQAKAPRKLVGSDGKLVHQPTGRQATFTGAALEPTITLMPTKFDSRYQVDPATFSGGEFSALGVGRYLA